MTDSPQDMAEGMLTDGKLEVADVAAAMLSGLLKGAPPPAAAAARKRFLDAASTATKSRRKARRRGASSAGVRFFSIVESYCKPPPPPPRKKHFLDAASAMTQLRRKACCSGVSAAGRWPEHRASSILAHSHCETGTGSMMDAGQSTALPPHLTRPPFFASPSCLEVLAVLNAVSVTTCRAFELDGISNLHKRLMARRSTVQARWRRTHAAMLAMLMHDNQQRFSASCTIHLC